MSVIRDTVERVAQSERVVHLAWLLLLLLVETGSVVAGGGSGGSGP
jgi:hypothetical protein